MSLTVHGNRLKNGSYAIQPGAIVVANEDGTLTGSASFEADFDFKNNLPDVGSAHPADGRLECTSAQRVFLENRKVRHNCTYFGVNSTVKRVTFSTGIASDPIETHPDFDQLAGSYKNPQNGAFWESRPDATNAKVPTFVGFFNDKGGKKTDLTGVTHYFTPGMNIEVSYYSRRVPSQGKVMTVVSRVPGVNTPSNVANFLYTGTSYRQIGRAFYQVTENYIASGPEGWNKKLYK